MESALKQQPITLTHYILEEQRRHPMASGDLSILLHAIEIASKYVSAQVRAAGIFDLYGNEGSTNIQGEVVKKLDTLANQSFITSLKRCKKVCIMASEEDEHPIVVSGSDGNYSCVFDPLDGSSNIDANVSIGTIFGIYHRISDKSKDATVEDLLQPGTSLVAAGYTLYGSATLLVLTTGNGVNGFTLDTTSGEFVLTHPNITMKPKGNIYSVNEGNSKFWHEPVKRYVDSLKYPKEGSPYSLRYVGSMVADVHRTLVYGGVFMYPADTRSKDGKLRLLYEANPMALLTEQAGGKATTGKGRLLEVVPDSVHQRTPVFLGSRQDIEALEKFFAEEN
ncbi:Fructose-1,6-bisphosphatase [Balamuthia mandrillaris]